MKLLKEDALLQVEADLELVQSELEETTESQKELSNQMATVSRKITEAQKEHEKCTQEHHRLKNAHRNNAQVAQTLEQTIHGLQKQIEEHKWEESVRKYITEYDSFYTFLEREIDKEQKRLQEVSPQKLEVVDAATATQKYKAMVEGSGISQGLVEMRSFKSHYDTSIRDMAETRANNRKVSLDQLRVPLQIVSRCVANRTTTSLWYL